MEQALFENFDFLIKVKGPLGQSIFFFLGGSDRVRFSGWSGSNRVVWTNGLDRGMEDDIIHDVIAQARVSVYGAWRMGARDMMKVVRVGA